MKKLLYIFLFVPLALVGQNNIELVNELTIHIDLDDGWNIIGYTCQFEKDAEEVFQTVQDDILIVKDNNGKTYWPEFSFNGIGNLIPGLGYQIKLNNPIHNFSFNHSCMFGCMSEWAENYYAAALLDDGSCFLHGCTSAWADNFNPNATIDDQSCLKNGCMDNLALSFDPQANSEDNSCQYLDDLSFEFGNTGSNMNLFINTPMFNQFDGGLFGAFYDLNGDEILESVTNSQTINYPFAISLWGDDHTTPQKDGLSTGDFPELWVIKHQENFIVVDVISDSFNGYVGGGMYVIDYVILSMNVECLDPNADNYKEITYTDVEINDLGACDYSGCMDPDAFNYNPNANLQGNSICIEKVYGCTDSSFVEFNPNANVNNGACIELLLEGCMDNNACNFNIAANINSVTQCVYPDANIDLDSYCGTCSGEIDGTGFVRPQGQDCPMDDSPGSRACTLCMSLEEYCMLYPDCCSDDSDFGCSHYKN